MDDDCRCDSGYLHCTRIRQTCVKGSMKTSVRSALAAFVAALSTSACHAHTMYESAVLLDFTGHEIRAELQLPLERMEAAFGRHIAPQLSSVDQAQFADYLLSHFFARSTDGLRFGVRLTTPLTV